MISLVNEHWALVFACLSLEYLLPKVRDVSIGGTRTRNMYEHMQSKIGIHQEQVMDTGRGLYPGHAAAGVWADSEPDN